MVVVALAPKSGRAGLGRDRNGIRLRHLRGSDAQVAVDGLGTFRCSLCCSDFGDRPRRWNLRKNLTKKSKGQSQTRMRNDLSMYSVLTIQTQGTLAFCACILAVRRVAEQTSGHDTWLLVNVRTRKRFDSKLAGKNSLVPTRRAMKDDCWRDAGFSGHHSFSFSNPNL